MTAGAPSLPCVPMRTRNPPEMEMGAVATAPIAGPSMHKINTSRTEDAQ